jgi:hypothetical protein
MLQERLKYNAFSQLRAKEKIITQTILKQNLDQKLKMARYRVANTNPQKVKK